MALSGLDIYKLLPKTNCKECGFPTCLAFAMQLAAKKVSLDKCPHVSAEAKAALEGASQPPVKLVTFGTQEKKVEVGNETVLFRHEETFYHPSGIGVLLEDSISTDELSKRIDKINKLAFDRVGKHVDIDIIAIKQTQDTLKYAEFVKAVLSKTKLAPVLIVKDAKAALAALESAKGRVPLLHGATSANYAEMAQAAKSSGVPLVVSGKDLSEVAELVEKIKSLGVQDLVIDTGAKALSAKLHDLTQIRRLAIKKGFRLLGYPVIAFTQSQDPYEEAAEASTYIDKYASIIILNGYQPWLILPILANRQDIYTDPQKPSQVEPKLYSFGSVTEKSPVMVTTNFSITYFTVAGEVEASRVPSYLISVDSEGMSVLTAWAAEKFTAEKIAEALKKSGIEGKVSHKKVILPGYVAVLSGKLQEDSGWEVLVGPKEAAGIPAFLKSLPK